MNLINKLLLAAYLLLSVPTFGHAWNRNWSRAAIAGGGQLIASVAASAAWPLYWSTVICQEDAK